MNNYRFKLGQVVRVVGLPNEDDVFEGLLVRVVALPESHLTRFFDDPERPAYEVVAEDIDAFKDLLDVYDEWEDVGKGIVYESEMQEV